MDNNILFFVDGAKELAKQLNGNEKIETGIRPYAFHAGNRASLIGLAYILCEEVEKYGKKAKFDFHIAFADTEQRVLVGTDIANFIFDTRPLDTTIQFSKEADGRQTTRVWGKYIQDEFGYIQKHFPEIKARFYYCSDLYKTHPVFKHLIMRTMEDQQKVKDIMLKTSGRETDNSNTSFALSVCPTCKDTHTHTIIDEQEVMVKCEKCGQLSKGNFHDFDYWLHHNISSIGSWEMFPQKENVVILGLDHYLYKDDNVRYALYNYFFNKNPIQKKCLYSSLVVDENGNKMGKSSKNYFDVSTEEILKILKLNHDCRYIKLLNQKTRGK